ncbi:MAG: hypothetical protein AAF675_12350 [Pseudomonadota bacterium]
MARDKTDQGCDVRRPVRADRDPNRLIRLVATGAGDGIAAGWLLLLAMVELDFQGLGTLVKGTEDGPFALLLMASFFGVTFGMVGIAWRVMVLLPDEE